MAAWNPKANEIFLAIIELDSDSARRAYLDQACAGNVELRGQVEALLKAHGNAGSFLEKPAGELAGPAGELAAPAGASLHQAETMATTSPAEGPGTRIGPYKLLQLIGEGGMGSVWMAEQREPVRRLVALKVIKAGMDSGQVVARFEAERQALALMDHPNIARVFDGGTTDAGRPFFVMELVKGTPITNYCNEHRLTIRQRLELFVQVCQAIQHAHQKGIIHRDIKPSNVFVAPFDGRPVVKVIDFGVAKATGQKLTDKTMYTEFGAVVGTMQYMSPEQAELNNQDIDTRSDIYSLGVLLYELLTGTTPLDMNRLRGAAMVAMLMAIKEDDPPKPSTRLSQLSRVGRVFETHQNSEAAPVDGGSRRLDPPYDSSLASLAAQRQIDPAKLAKSLRGELDSIVMKALEKDRTRRFATALELAADIERHLSNEPVLACPPSLGYRLKKFTRKHRVPMTAVFAVLATLILGLVSTSFLYFEANERRTAAELAEQKAITEAERADRNARRADDKADQARGNLNVAQMNLAQVNWEGARITNVLGLLKRSRPRPGEKDLRGFEWYYWDRLCHSELATLKGHTSGVRSVAFSPDGTRIASASDDATVKLWDAATGQVTATLKGHTGEVRSVVFSPNGTRIASASGDQTIKLWDAATGQETATLKGHTNGVTSVAFSPDGTRIASAGGWDDQTVKVWDAATGQETATLKGHTGPVKSIAFSPDGTRIASASHDEPVKLWDAATGQEIATLKGHTSEGWSVAFSPDGTRIASGSDDQTVRLWDAATGQETATLKGHRDMVTSVAFSPDGRQIASASWDQTIKLWDAATGQETATLQGHTSFVLCVVFSPNGTRVASASMDGTVKLWDAAMGQETATLKGHTSDVTSISFSPDGTRIASAGGEVGNPDEVKLWDAATGQETTTLKGHTDGILSVAFSPDGTRIASASYDQTVKLWDAATGQETATLKGHTGAVTSVAFSPDGMRIASTSDGQIKLWDARPWTPELRVEQQALVVVRFLWAKCKLKEEFIQKITADRTISDPVRRRALELAEVYWDQARRSESSQ